ncbi:bifunctional NAD(P)H-hydrate repair enzyme Nnr [Spirochaetia bacterium]|nr:bifunctional NAD(P)H-hydrate repair enzyme Nnr [Spirochaetia bacterium]
MIAQDGPAVLLSAASARALDQEASASWGLEPFALVEAAGRRCAQVLTAALPCLFPAGVSGTPNRDAPRIVGFAGSGSNAADAMVLLRSLLLSGYADAERSLLVINKVPAVGEHNPRSEAFRSLVKMEVPVLVWENAPWDSAVLSDCLKTADLIIDGIAGTGLEGPLRGQAAEMARAINKLKKTGHTAQNLSLFIVSIDVPSGISDSWKPGMPIVEADAVLAIEPLKLCLFRPAARPYGGIILPVGEIFPSRLIAQFCTAELIAWDYARALIPRVNKTAYKYERGVAEIRAGSPDTPGAARIAARGAQAAGAGLVRLVVDQAIHPILAVNAGGVMVAAIAANGGDTAVAGGGDSRFNPDAILLGPGWGKSPDREIMLRRALEKEAAGIPLILDADAILLAKDQVFHGNALLTPHPGELAAYAGVSKDEILADPAPLLLRLAAEKNAHFLFKSHVMYAASPAGRLSIIDGMAPVLGMGGTGDLLAGFCTGIAARCFAIAEQWRAAGWEFSLYSCALAAAALLIESAKSPALASRFLDPLELADRAANLAGEAWLT